MYIIYIQINSSDLIQSILHTIIFRININHQNKMNEEVENQQEEIKTTISSQQQLIRRIIMNRALFPKNPLDETIFQSDLVIKLDFPQQRYSKRPKVVNIGSLVSKPTSKLLRAYNLAFKILYKDMERKGEDVEKVVANGKQIQTKINKELRVRSGAAFRKIKQNKNQLTEQLQMKGCSSSQAILKAFDYEPLISKSKKQEYQRVIDEQFTYKEQIKYSCQEEYSGVIDAFIINLNTTIYVLQHHCQFTVRSFLFSGGKSPKGYLFKEINQESMPVLFKHELQNTKRQVFLFLYAPNNVLLKAANNFRIKKELSYHLLDPFLNEPKDSKQRPLKFHPDLKFFKQQQENISQQKYQKQNKQNKKNIKKQSNFRKKQERKLNFKSVTGSIDQNIIAEEVNFKQTEKNNYQSFVHKFLQQTNNIVGKQGQQSFNSSVEGSSLLCKKQLDYVKRINRGKYNKGVEKVFMQIKKQKQYIAKLTELSCQYGYQTFEYPRLFVPFQLPSKHKNYFDRLRHLLMYKPYAVSPDGDLALFNKMERIKLSYLILQKYFSLENFSQFNADIFALNDDFQKFGFIGSEQNQHQFHYHEAHRISQNQNSHPITCHTDHKKITGGINGKSLASSWRSLLVWKNDFFVIRAYLGEKQAHQMYVKTKLIQLFFALSLIGAGTQFFQKNFLEGSILSYGSLLLIILAYFTIVTIVYAVFLETFTLGEKVLVDNFEDEYQVHEFRGQYKGPYIRNKITDRVNDYSDSQLQLFDQIKKIFFVAIILILIGLEIGFYYLIKYLAVEIAQHIDDFDRTNLYFIYPNYFIAYSIFFIVNEIVGRVFLYPLFVWMTNFENCPTQQKYQASISTKVYLFMICTELIAPIDLVFIQFAAKTFCSSNWCYFDLEAYAFYRYLMMLFTLLLKFTALMHNNIKRYRAKAKKNKQEPGQQIKNDVRKNCLKRLQNYLDFAYRQSKSKIPERMDLYEESLQLLIFCTFVIVFPLGVLISFLLLLISYIIQRRDILRNQQRSIPKSTKIETYSNKFTIGLHWLLFFNFSQLIFSFRWIQDSVQGLVIALVPNPTFSSVIILKFSALLALFIVFEFIVIAIRMIVRKNYNFIEMRKINLYNKFVELKNITTTQSAVQITHPHPLNTISRVFNRKNRKTIFKNQQSQVFSMKQYSIFDNKSKDNISPNEI